MAVITRRKALIAGAAGGIGRACARLFGAARDLVLTDAAGPALERFADELRERALPSSERMPATLAVMPC